MIIPATYNRSSEVLAQANNMQGHHLASLDSASGNTLMAEQN